MAQTTVNTRLVLRNDTVTNWQNSAKILLKGEVALALLSDNKYDIRIGDGTKSWKDLSSNVVIPVENISNLDTKLQDFQIVSAELTGTEDGNSYKLQTKPKSEIEWTDVDGSRFNIPSLQPLKDDIAAIKENIKNGVHFIGIAVDKQTTDTAGQYKLTTDGKWQTAKNGDVIVIKNADVGAIEYIWSDANKTWEEFGDEGHHATKTFVTSEITTAVKQVKEDIANDIASLSVSQLAWDISCINGGTATIE